MKIEHRDFTVRIPNLEGTAVAEEVTIKIPVKWDAELQDWLLTPEAHQLIDDTKARHMGLLVPSEMKELRERLGCTQKQMGELLQVGEKSWTRWESGKHRPSRSINLLLRALYEGEISQNYLHRLSGLPEKASTKEKLADWCDLQFNIQDLSPEMKPVAASTPAMRTVKKSQPTWANTYQPGTFSLLKMDCKPGERPNIHLLVIS